MVADEIGHGEKEFSISWCCNDMCSQTNHKNQNDKKIAYKLRN